MIQRQAQAQAQAVVTAYCLGPCTICQTKGITRWGRRQAKGVAISRRRSHWRRGQKLRIPGYGRAIIDDVGGGVKNNQLDVRFRFHESAVRWGKRKLNITVIGQKRREATK